MIQIGDYVVRKSYNGDILFEVCDIKDDNVILRGVEIRLEADANIKDLEKKEKKNNINDEKYNKLIKEYIKNNRDEYFYLPGKILHIDSDKNYLKRCLNFYKKANVLAIGMNIKEEDLPGKIESLLEEINPDILIITGHDAYYKKREENNTYKNSKYFIDSVKEARKFEKSNDKLVIIAGACQSNYEELIKAGATFASSPKRINIHALDPAIIATTISLSSRNDEINLIELLSKTKYGKDGMGGLKSKGMMYIGYPR